MTTSQNSPMSDQEAWKLLPWLVTDRLDEPELHQLLDHLKVSPTSRRELRFLSDLGHVLELGQEPITEPEADPEPALGRLMARIDTNEQAALPQELSWQQRWAEFFGLHRRLFLALAQAAGVACLTLAVAWSWQPAAVPTATTPSPAPREQFRTLSIEARPATEPSLRLVFQPQTMERDIRRLLRTAGGEIVAGPTQFGVYTVTLGDDLSDDLSAATVLDELRSDPAVALAELAAGSMPAAP